MRPSRLHCNLKTLSSVFESVQLPLVSTAHTYINHAPSVVPLNEAGDPQLPKKLQATKAEENLKHNVLVPYMSSMVIGNFVTKFF